MTAKTTAAEILKAPEAEANQETMTIISNETMSTSAKIRALYAIHNDRGVVANLLGKRYQHVRNVLLTPLTGAKKD